jgi:sugar phosphate isomerase/epimerase
MYLPNRREFLQAVTAVAATGFSDHAMLASPRNPREPHVDFPTAPHDRISLTSYPFRAYIESPNNKARDPHLPGMTLGQFAAMAGGKLGVRHIEPHGRHFQSLEPEYLSGVRESFHNSKVDVVDLAAPDLRLYDADSSVRKEAIAQAKQWVDAAVLIASPSMRPHIQSASHASAGVEVLSESLREVSDYAAERNIVIVLENDDPVSEDAFFLVKVIEAVRNPYLRALPDFANSLMAGDAEFNYRSLQTMFQHAFNVCHVKDRETNDQGKELHVDLKRCFDILKASGYRGYCSIEYDSPGDPFGPTAQLIEQTVKYLS